MQLNTFPPELRGLAGTALAKPVRCACSGWALIWGGTSQNSVLGILPEGNNSTWLLPGPAFPRN